MRKYSQGELMLHRVLMLKFLMNTSRLLRDYLLLLLRRITREREREREAGLARVSSRCDAPLKIRENPFSCRNYKVAYLAYFSVTSVRNKIKFDYLKVAGLPAGGIPASSRLEFCPLKIFLRA